MNSPPPGSFSAILDALGHGLPMLIVQVVACAVLLAIGVAIYVAVTPFRERAMVASGNPAAGTMLAGAILALAIPLAAMLATSSTLVDITGLGRGRADLATADARYCRAGHAQSSRHDRGRQCRRGDHIGWRTNRRRPAQRGGNGAKLNLEEESTCWPS